MWKEYEFHHSLMPLKFYKEQDYENRKIYIAENLRKKIFIFFPKTDFGVVYLPRITTIN